ncbi:MAG: dehydrogenase [Gemmatimonadaceae bacterium]
MRAVVARAPTRIDFGGGWTDVPPYCDERGGCVCSVAIARYATARLAPSDTGESGSARGPAESPNVSPLGVAALRHAGVTGATMRLTADVPAGSGLGSSAAAGVAAAAAIAAWQDRTPSRSALAEESRAVEVNELQIAGGRQDHYAAAWGGALGLWFGGGGTVRVQRIELTADVAAELARRCVVGFTGETRLSSRTVTAVLDAYAAGERHVVDALGEMAVLAESMVGALERGSVDELGRLVSEHWVHQRSLHAEITTPAIERVIEASLAGGALGAKALGASGGGCVVAIAGADGVERVRKAIGQEAELMDFAVDTMGVQIVAGSGVAA